MSGDYSGVRSTGSLERIVSLSPSNTEILFAVGAGDKVVGVSDYCDYPAEVEERVESNEIVRVGGYWNPSVETILGLDPDLVLVSTAKCTQKTNNCKINCSRKCELTIKTANELKNLGLNVLTLAPHSLADVLQDILTVGKFTRKRARAFALVESLKERIDKVVARSRTLSKGPKVYFEVWKDPYISVNSETWVGNLIDLAGGTNIFGDSVSEWPMIRPEDVVQRNPDVLLFPVIPGVPRFWGSFEYVKNRKGWAKINAVRNDRLYEVIRDCISRPGPRLVETLELLEKLFCKS